MPDRFWRMTLNHQKRNHMVAPIAAATPEVVPLPGHTSVASDPWYMAMELGNALCSVPNKEEKQKPFTSHGIDSSTHLESHCTLRLSCPLL